jgi:hypothetical protein
MLKQARRNVPQAFRLCLLWADFGFLKGDWRRQPASLGRRLSFRRPAVRTPLSSPFREIPRGCGAISESHYIHNYSAIKPSKTALHSVLTAPTSEGGTSARAVRNFKRQTDRPTPACSRQDASSDSRRLRSADNARPRLPPRSSGLFRPSRPDWGRRKRRSNTAPARCD